MSDDVFKEIEEDIREERIHKLWRAYGNYVIWPCTYHCGRNQAILFKYMKHQSLLKAHVSFSQAVNLMKQGKKKKRLLLFKRLLKKGEVMESWLS